jgi:lysophospholipase
MKRAYFYFVLLCPALFAWAVPEGDLARDYPEKILPYLNSGRTGYFEGKDGYILRYIAFEKEDERAALVVLGGHSESYVKYAEFFYDMKDLPVSIYALDQRGQGFSARLLPDREKDHVESWKDYVADLKLFIDRVVRNAGPHERTFVLGHSMGGGVAAAYLEEYPGDLSGAILSAPLVRTTFGFFGNIVLNVIGFFGGGNGYVPGGGPYAPTLFKDNKETHSEARHERKLQDYMDYPEIRLGYPTVHWALEMNGMAEAAQSKASSIKVPVLVLRADEDAYTDEAGVDEFCRKPPDCRKVFLQGSRHEMLIERDDIRDLALAEIRGFLEGKSR